MAQPVIQTSFNAGEWAPALNARVDLTKYHSGAALLRNFFVDYRGGATTRPGTRYILQCFRSATQVRVIPFQASFSVSYILEFGNQYIRFFNNGAPVLEGGTAITAATRANPGVITDVAHGYSSGDWVFISGVVGMTQLNGNYYIVTNQTANTYQLTDLQGNIIDTSAFTAYVSGGTAQRVYTLVSPYLSSELSQIKFTQNVSNLVICHPNHAPYILTLLTAANWTIAPITFGTTIAAPSTPTILTTLGAGSVNYAYIVTTVDVNGQESAPSAFGTLTNVLDIRSSPGTNTVTWSAVTGATSYNVYKAEPRYSAAVPVGSQFGFIGNVTGLALVDSNIVQDFSQSPPIVQNPFAGSGVVTVSVGSVGSFGGNSNIPIVSFTGGGGSGAQALATLGCIGVGNVTAGINYVVGDTITISGGFGCTLQVTSINAFGGCTGASITSVGSIASGSTPANPVNQGATSGIGSGAQFNLTWGLQTVGVTSPGTGYSTPPTVGFDHGGPTATCTLGAPSSGNPTVPGYFQQRLVLAGPVGNPQQFNMSQPGNYYNFNVNNPIEADNAIQENLVSGKLNTIKSMISMPAGLVFLSDQQAWLINGGASGAPISALAINANSQAYNGASDLPPIVANYDILYVQAKSSIVRDLSYNFYTNVYAGANISTLSSHLFFGFTLSEWAWAEEPFKLVWAVRNDGDLLSLTFQKDQEMIAWTHHDTVGAFKSIATVTEILTTGPVDAVYTVVQRVVNGQSLQYVERMQELLYPQGFKNSWFLDAGINYNGTPASTFSGAAHLGGALCTGVADGTVIAPFTMPASGTFTPPGGPYSIVTVGLPIVGQIQTLALDLGEPTVQGKWKKIVAVTVRNNQSLGLSIGRTFDTSSQTPMKDLVLGNLGTMTNALVTDLVIGDARTLIDPLWDVPGQYCIQQTNPYPASVLGIIPEIAIGDTK